MCVGRAINFDAAKFRSDLACVLRHVEAADILIVSGACMHVYMKYMYTCICIYVYICVYMCVYVHIYSYTHTHTHTHNHI